MALRFMDGFDSYVTADLTKKWTSINSSPAISAGNGRRSTASLRSVSASNTYVTRLLDSQPTWIIGMALRFTSYPSANVNIMDIRDTSTTQISLRLSPTGAIVVGSNTTTATLALNTYHYVEWFVTVHASAGVVKVQLDGVEILSATGQDTWNAGAVSANTVRVGMLETTLIGTMDIDDVYICDGTGSAPHNTFLGDCRVDTLLPNADGTSQQWTPSTPGTHYTLVDDAAPNTTDYVSSATIGHRDTYGMQDLAASTGTIYGVQLNLAAHKEDAGARLLKPLIVSGASEALGASVGLSTSQTYTRHIQTTDPATAAAWTESGVNAAQCGAEVA